MNIDCLRGLSGLDKEETKPKRKKLQPGGVNYKICLDTCKSKVEDIEIWQNTFRNNKLYIENKNYETT